MTLTAKQIPADQAGSGWYEILPAPGPARILNEDISADWVVVGAGFAGLSAAKRILQNSPSDKVVVVDAQRVAWGAAGRNSGFMIDLPHNLQSEDYAGQDNADKKEIRLNRFAIEFARNLVEEFDLQEHVSGNGKINAATDQAGMDALDTYSSHLQKLNEPFEKYSAQDLKDICGIDYYKGGIFTPGCMVVQPAGYIRGIADGLARNIDIYENSPVVKIETGDNLKIYTANGSVRAGRIIMAVNGHLESFGLFKRQLMHIYTFGSMSRVLSKKEQNNLGGESEWGITPAHPMGSSVRRLKQGRIVVRHTFTYNPNMRTNHRQIASLGKKHEKSFRNRFPMLPDVDMEYCWGGHLCLSLNSVPAFGEVEPGIFVACCQNGLGAVKGTLAGVLAVDQATGSNQQMVVEMLNYDQPKKLYPEPFMSIGAKSHLWWTHKQAGKDI